VELEQRSGTSSVIPVLIVQYRYIMKSVAVHCCIEELIRNKQLYNNLALKSLILCIKFAACIHETPYCGICNTPVRHLCRLKEEIHENSLRFASEFRWNITFKHTAV
jgi:hypothetical protein